MEALLYIGLTVALIYGLIWFIGWAIQQDNAGRRMADDVEKWLREQKKNKPEEHG